MRFALLGCNDDSLRIATAIVDCDSHAIASIHHADAFREQLVRLAPAADWPDQWESLLATGEVDAVIVSPHADPPLFEDQCRKLVQARVPLVVSHPLGDSLFAYELEMMRQEAGGIILAFAPGYGHPAFERLARLIEAGESSEIGAAEQVVIERYLPERDRDHVLRVLAVDVTLQRQLIGQISSINAIGAEPDDARLSNLAVNVTGTTDVLGRWSVGPVTDDRTATITLVGTGGTAVLTAYGASRRWSLRIGSETIEFDLHDDASAVIRQLQRALDEPDFPSDWEAVCHDLDATEQVQRSLRRKRTIELRRDAQNEEGAFKGIMSAGSCLVLLLTLLLLVLFAVIEGFRMPLIDAQALRENGQAVPRAHVLLRLWPVYPLAAFLLLQLLVFVAKRPRPSKDAPRSGGTLPP